MKPDIVFFGEGLPPRFFQLTEGDFEACDLLLVIGTSLVVQPFASLVGESSGACSVIPSIVHTVAGQPVPCVIVMMAFDLEWPRDVSQPG